MAKSLINGAPEEIRTPDPQIRSLGSAIEIIEVCYRKNAVTCQRQRISQILMQRVTVRSKSKNGA